MEEKVKELTPHQVAKLLADTGRQAQDAVSGCLNLLERISSSGITGAYKFQKVNTIISEILENEINHVTKLTHLIIELSGIQPKNNSEMDRTI